VQFHRRVRHRFLELASNDRDRYLVLDAESSPEFLHYQVMQRVGRLLPAQSGSRLRNIARGLAGARQ
jgi:dTMP kinase